MTAGITHKNIVIYAANLSYLPARQLIELLPFNIEAIAVNKLDCDVRDFKNSKTALMFITPGDLAEVIAITRCFIEAAVDSGIERLAWIAPAAGEASKLGTSLTTAASLVQDAKRNSLILDSLILRHAPLLSDLLELKKEIKFRRTLSLPLENNAIPWVAPEDIALGLYRWLVGETDNEPPKILTGRSQLTGADLAGEITRILRRNSDGLGFALRCFKAIDTDRSGKLDRQEMSRYLMSLAYTQEEAEALIEKADTNHDGSIDFNEFMADFGQHLDKILADLPCEVQYVNVPRSTVLHDLMTKGMAEQTAQSWLDLITSFKSSQLPVRSGSKWLGRVSTSASDWLEQHLLDFISVYILPARGILTINEATFAERPALSTRILQSNDRLLVGIRTLDNKVVEWQWADEDLTDAEVVRYKPEKGGERVLKFKNNKLVSMSVRGLWSGRRLANELLFQQQPIPRWQINLFRELGELRIEEVSSLIDSESMVCNCTQTTCGQLQDMIDSGMNTIEKIANDTQITLICGGCQPLVEELLGSANLTVAELLLKQDLGRNLFRFQFRPVGQEVLPYLPGQHILIQGRVDGIWVTRAYTLSSNADRVNRYEITVKREEMGLFSRWLCDRADRNSLFRISQPRGEYVLRDESPVYFFAAGIGVTPAIAMIRTLVIRGDQRPFHLDWSAPHREDFVFKAELERVWAKFPNFSFLLHPTRTQGRLTAETIRERYAYTEGAVAFLCGPQAYMDRVRSHLVSAGWLNEAIRQELFSSELDEEGNVEVKPRPAVQLAGGIDTVEAYSFDVQEIVSIEKEAEAFLKQCYLERGLPEVFLPRWQEVQQAIAKTESYQHTLDELSYGARLAWRNSSRCIGRYFWQSLKVRDMRHLKTEEEMFQALVEHIKLATNNGDIRAMMTAFKPDGRRLWNSQLLRYAGYRQLDRSILGDPANLELTEQALKLGWQPKQRTAFDYLPLIIQLPGKEPRWFEIPPEIILDVPISHPRYQWFKELGLKWYALPAISNMSLDLGGIQYTCAPFSGFYMGTEIGGRNLSDTYRYNMLPVIGDRMGLDCTSNDTLWKDLALVELNIAVLHSFKQQGVRLIDHHTMGDYFIQFMEDEKNCQRPVHADWGWIIPPVSGSLCPVYPLKLDNRILKPNYFYMPDPWKSFKGIHS